MVDLSRFQDRNARLTRRIELRARRRVDPNYILQARSTPMKNNRALFLASFFTLIACSLIADRVGYKALMVLAFLLHVSSAIVTFAATPIFDALGGRESSSAQDAAFQCLYWGAFLFSLGNGVCESVINPLVATL